MNRIGLALIAAGALALSADAFAQSGAQAGAQGSAQASADVSKQGAQASASGATSVSGAANAGQTNAAFASGSTLNATLDAPLDSKKCKPGDRVHARSTEPAKSGAKTVFPKGTKLEGHVTQASARAKGDSESAIGIVFDRAILKNGEEVPLNVAIQAMASADASASALGSDAGAIGGVGGSAAASGATGGRGALGGVTSSAGGALGTVTNTAANVGGTAGGTLNSASNATGNVVGSSKGAIGGLNAAGQLTSNSQGVFGMNGLNLSSALSNDTEGTLITSAGKNVHLDSGTRLLLVSQAGSAPRSEPKQSGAEKPRAKN